VIYGLYLSATGVQANSYRQDVIANNIANADTVGFKRHLAVFQERPTEAQAQGRSDLSDPMLENLGGGFLVSPTMLDTSQGEMETTGNNLDTAIFGKGYFAVDDNGQTKLTRDGEFMLDKDGNLILNNSQGNKVLNSEGKPIQLPGLLASNLQIDKSGQINYQGQPLAQLGVFDVPDQSQLVKQGGNLFDYPNLAKSIKPSESSELRSGFVERANVDPTSEMTQLMETQRQLEANANMIRYQDQSLTRLVNDVGKIG
jgi:flagellar basal-body rod protein FlgG